VSKIPDLIFLFVSPIYSIAVIFYIASVITDEAISIHAAWRLGIKFWLPYFVLLVHYLVLMGVGLLFLIIPGVYLGIRFSFAFFELLFVGKNPKDALKISWEKTKGHEGTILGGGLILMACFYFPVFILSSLFDPTSMAYWLFYSLVNILESLFGALFTIFMFRIYWQAEVQHNKSLNMDASDAGAG